MNDCSGVKTKPKNRKNQMKLLTAGSRKRAISIRPLVASAYSPNAVHSGKSPLPFGTSQLRLTSPGRSAAERARSRAVATW